MQRNFYLVFLGTFLSQVGFATHNFSRIVTEKGARILYDDLDDTKVMITSGVIFPYGLVSYTTKSAKSGKMEISCTSSSGRSGTENSECTFENIDSELLDGQVRLSDEASKFLHDITVKHQSCSGRRDEAPCGYSFPADVVSVTDFSGDIAESFYKSLNPELSKLNPWSSDPIGLTRRAFPKGSSEYWCSVDGIEQYHCSFHFSSVTKLEVDRFGLYSTFYPVAKAIYDVLDAPEQVFRTFSKKSAGPITCLSYPSSERGFLGSYRCQFEL